MTIEEKTKQILDDNLYMTLSVSSKAGEPWIANAFFAYDKKLNLYWYSSKETKHSHYIKENPNVALAIFNSTAVGGEVDAVYIKATASEVSSQSELLHGLHIYGSKMLQTGFIKRGNVFEKFVNGISDFLGESVLRLYKATPQEIYKLAPSQIVNDKFVDSRIPVDMSEVLNLY